ncbi:MCE family protein [Saccharopolyspora sp.]|uniref:MCE family protein n=1 Tax=Saccharopolyspora sp. TaxID=33915 RepID=UPI0025DC97B2|nr:MCE family protein [Saccharopolyspora sp.]
MSTRSAKFPITRLLAIGCAVVLLATAGVWWMFSGNDKRVTAYFTAAVGIYPGGDVRMLGVPMGTVDEVVPQGRTVRVTMSLDRDVTVPAEARAVAVSPSVVSDRYVQLAPVYKGGPQLRDGAVIPKERTATPVELDEVYRSLNDLTHALGPQGANKNGALTDLLNTGAANLDGNGQALADTLQHLGQAGTTLSGSSKDLFATVDNLQKFTGMLSANDQQVRRFNDQMQEVSSLLAGEREDLGASMAELAVALGKVESFVRDNRENLKSNVDQLNSVAKVLVDQKSALAESLTDAPLALGNLQNSYNAASGTLDTRAVINELNQPPLVSVCKLVRQPTGGTPVELPGNVLDACKAIQPVLDGLLPVSSIADLLSQAQGNPPAQSGGASGGPAMPLGSAGAPLVTGGGQ